MASKKNKPHCSIKKELSCEDEALLDEFLTLLAMIALTVVVLIRVVGMILVIALLTFPAAMARLFTYEMKKMMLLSVIFGFLFTLGGLWLSYELKLPSGATIILLGGIVLAISFGVSRLCCKNNKIKEAV